MITSYVHGPHCIYPTIGQLGKCYELLKEFQKEYPQYKTPVRTLSKWLYDFNMEMIEEVANQGGGVSMPQRLGILRVQNYKSQSSINYPLSLKLGTKIKNRWYDTNDYVPFINLYSKKGMFKMCDMWKYVCNRTVRNRIVKTYPQNFLRYSVLDRDYHYRQRCKKIQKMKRKKKVDLTGYNEFEL